MTYARFDIYKKEYKINKFNGYSKYIKKDTFLYNVIILKKRVDVKIGYFQIYKDIWEFHKRNNNVSSNEDYWVNLINEGRLLAAKYKNNKFVMDLILSVLEELERRCKELAADEG